MSRNLVRRLPTVGLCALAACGGDSTGPSLSCTGIAPTTLAAGAFTVMDPTVSTVCAAVPAAPGAGAEYLYVAVATAGQEVAGGVQTGYTLLGAPGATADVAALPSPLFSSFRPPATAEQFHMMLRAREKAVSRSPAAQAFAARVGRAPSLTITKPTVGTADSFWVCANDQCSSFVRVGAHAQHVGAKVAIFTDDSQPPGGGYLPSDLGPIGDLFDNFLYPIDTTNFGRESDIDSNSVVKVLLTPRINQLSGNCNTTKSVILGYFLSTDLVPSSDPHSNGGEIFYSLVPDPANPSCTISQNFAKDNLAPTFIHEFQHMISFNQHFLLRNGQAEDTWLNEGLSHYAEELGGRLIPDAQNPTKASSPNTYTQFALSDFQNAYEYLDNPEAHFLIEPSESGGTLEERGANWLMTFWLANQFGTLTPDSARFIVRGTDFTRKLVQSDKVGAANVEAQTGESFANLVPEWQLANYLDDLPGFVPASGRLQYPNLNLRAVYASLNSQTTCTGQQTTFCKPYPLTPDSTSGSYSRTGTLRAGSGRHVRILQPAGGAAVELKLTAPTGAPLPSSVRPRVGLARIR